MKHLGLHEFPQQIEVNEIEAFDTILLNKLNIPFHKSLEGEEFGDLFTENNAVKFVNDEGEINLILDLNNTDIIKNLLINEILFDNMLNYGEEYNKSNSLHSKLLLDQDILQNDLTFSVDATIYVDTTVSSNIIELDFENDILASDTYDNFLPYMSSGLPLFTKYTNTIDSTVIEQMSTFDSIELIGPKIILTLKNEWFPQIVGSNLFEIITFNFVDNLTDEPMIKLPPHLHMLSHISDLEENTNVENGYIQLTGTDLRFGFDQSLQLQQGRVSNSVFVKDQKVQLENENHFTLNTSNSLLDDNIGFVETIIDLGGDTTAIEYDSTSIDLTFTDELQIITKSGQLATTNSIISISDFTNFQSKYLVEIVEFNYDYVFGSESLDDTTSLLNIKYEWVDMTSINTLTEYDIDTSSKQITIIAGYYEVGIIQPDINTIPTTILNYTRIGKDIKNDIMLIKPTTFENNDSLIRLNLYDRSVVNVQFNDSTVSTLELTIESFDIASNTQSTEVGIFTSDLKIWFDRGMYRITPSTDMYTFNVSFY